MQTSQYRFINDCKYRIVHTGKHEVVIRFSSKPIKSLQVVLLGPGHFREEFWRADGTLWVFCAQDVEAIKPELHSKSAEEDEEEHDQGPLTSSCRHEDVLRKQEGVCRGVKDGNERFSLCTWSQNSCIRPYKLQLYLVGLLFMIDLLIR